MVSEKRLSSDYLINCMGKADYLVMKLEDKCFAPRWVLEDISFILESGDRIARSLSLGFPMICFCDMTFEDLKKQHLNEYGPFGIVMKKSWGMASGLNPVTYIAKDSLFISFIQRSLKIIFSNQTCINEEIDVVLKKHLIKILRHFKPYHDHLNKNGKVYYDEREWRFLPDLGDAHFLTADRFDTAGRLKKKYEGLNEVLGKVACNLLTFKTSQVAGIVVDNMSNRKLAESKIKASKRLKTTEKEYFLSKIMISG